MDWVDHFPDFFSFPTTARAPEPFLCQYLYFFPLYLAWWNGTVLNDPLLKRLGDL